MTVVRTLAIALTGLNGQLVEVEAAVSSQLPGIAVIGLPDAALAEAKQRIRVACQSSGFALSHRFITLNLSPADLPKNGSGFDLAMALAALSASGVVGAEQMASIVHTGELGLDGSVRRARGVLPTVLAAKQLGIASVMVPTECLTEAQLVRGIQIIPIATLAEAVAWYRGETVDAPPVFRRSQSAGTQTVHASSSVTSTEQDMSDVVGHGEAVQAMVIAAVGNHHVSMLGPPGTGKTMLAARLPSILPDLNDQEAIEVTSIASLQEQVKIDALLRRPPFESPHHTVTLAAMLGSGARSVTPGVITRASRGVLFLDEAPEFSRSVLDSLRQPLESGSITIQRARLNVTLPASFMLVLAANPCPCGKFGVRDAQCNCTGGVRQRYGAKLSGPLKDRVDLHLDIPRVTTGWHLGLSLSSETHTPTSAELRSRVRDARRRTAHRLRHTPWQFNAQLSGAWLRHSDHRPPREATAALDEAFDRGLLSMRAYDRVLRVAWSLADLEEESSPTRSHVTRALSYRSRATR